MRPSDEQPSVRQKTGERTPAAALAGDGPIPGEIGARNHVTSGLFRFSATQFLVALIPELLT